jgi:hypothetical protein
MKQTSFSFSQAIEGASFIAPAKCRGQSARPLGRHGARAWRPPAPAGRGSSACAAGLLALGMLLALPTLVQAQLSYVTNNGAITITGYTGTGGAVTIPGTINGLPVTSIGDSAFYSNSSLAGVIIPDGVTNIGDSAFANCWSLTNITIPNGVLSIGDSAFVNCSALTAGTIPASVTNLGAGVFGSCYSLTAITVDTNNPAYSSLAGVLFDKSQTTLITCPAGQSGTYTIPNTVANLADAAFAGSLLNTVTIPNTVTNIGDCVFADCVALSSVTLPNSVTSIGDRAFFSCYSLTNLTIPNNVTSIGDQAFAECTALTNVAIGGSLGSLGNAVFADCTGLTAITVDTNSPAFTSVAGILFDKRLATLIQYPAAKAGTSYAIPEGVTSIGPEAFYVCLDLASVTIPNSVTSIGDKAFSDCTALTNVAIGESVGSIGDAAFESCTRLASAALPNSVTSLGDYAFAWCPALTGLTLPNGVTNIGDYAFAGCAGLTGVTIPDTVAGIGSYAFAGCAGLSSLTVPDSVASIGDAAFAFCSGLTAISVGANNPAFSSIAGVLFDKSQATLIEYPSRNTGTSYTVPNTVTTIQDYGFFNCANLSTVTIPGSVTGIGADAFNLCGSLTGAYFLGNAPTLGGPYAFNGENLATVYYLPGTSGWGSTFGGLPTALWALPYPLILNTGSNFGAQTNGFGFIISWATNISVVVEATANLANPVWTPVATNTLAGGLSYFADPQWTNYPKRFYRITSP